MKIIQITAELFPYAKTGGLADMVGSLAAALADNGHDVSVFIPGYKDVFRHNDTKAAKHCLHLNYSDADIQSFSPRKNLTVYLVCNNLFFDREGIYGIDGQDFIDNHKRYLFFSKAVIEAMRLLKLKSDIVHCHDWQTALIPMLLREAELFYGLTLAKKSIFTIHNVAFQGKFQFSYFSIAELPEKVFDKDELEFNGQVNMLKNAIIFADEVTTVSPSYAMEIQTKAFGCGLEGVLALQTCRLTGLLNGIDKSVWNPSTDTYLPAHYSSTDIKGKQTCRAELLKKLFSDTEFTGAVFGMICRLTDQKGIDLVLANADFFRGNCRLIILGSGEKRYQNALRYLSGAIPDNICFINSFDEAMSHLIEAGSDFFLMPSLYEPCGLNQMYSLNYGTIPLVSQVGGLRDTVIDIDASPLKGTGITFPPTALDLHSGLIRAVKLFNDKTRFTTIQQRGMNEDFSWTNAVLAYEQLYLNTTQESSFNKNTDSAPYSLCQSVA